MVAGAEGSECSCLEISEKEKKKRRITGAASLSRPLPSSAAVFAAQPEEPLSTRYNKKQKGEFLA